MIPGAFRGLALAAALLSPASTDAKAGEIQLVLQITVDQLRGDMLSRFKDRFRPDGFRYLMDLGVHYANAHFGHSATLTAVGHATLVTGGHSAQHGMVGNHWFDRMAGKPVYCVEDDSHKIIGKKTPPGIGTSPRNLTSNTIGDEMVLASGGKSRVFSVSIKDRGAIIPGGHLGKAFWYAPDSGEFVTSTFYYREIPDWVETWNAAAHADKYRDRFWKLKSDSKAYIADKDDRPFEKSYGNLGHLFPHPLHHKDRSAFYRALRYTPYGDEFTLAFVKELITREKLGRGDAVDFLAVSLSATDYIGHAFGPLSLEYEDNLFRLDASMADLFAYIDSEVGLDKSLIVLSADHGVDEAPERRQKLGFEAGRLRPQEFMAAVNSALQKRFGCIETLLVAFFNPSLYLDRETIQKLGLDPVTVETALAEEMRTIPGIASIVTRSDLMATNLPDTPLMKAIHRSFHPDRSGDVIIVQKPFWYLAHKPERYTATHGSPYTYDTYVPLLFHVPDVKPRTVYRRVAPADIAPTLAFILGIDPPPGSVGTPLNEVLDRP